MMDPPASHVAPSRLLARLLFPATVMIWLVTSVAMPATYYVLQRNTLRVQANDQAQRTLDELRHVTAAWPAPWKHQPQRLDEVVRQALGERGVGAARIRDERGGLLAEAMSPGGTRPWWEVRVLSDRAPLIRNDRRLGTVEIEVMDRRLVPVSLGITAISTLFGLALAVFVQTFPVRVVRRAERAGEARLLRVRRLAELSQAIAASLDIDRVLRLVTDATAELLGCDVVRLWVVEPGGRTIRLGASGGDVDASAGMRTELDIGEGIVGWVVQHRRRLASPDLRDERRMVNTTWAVAGGFRSQITVPLCVAERPVGALAALSRAPRSFTQEEIELLEVFAAKAATALDNARLYAESRRQREQLATLVDVTQRLTRGLDQGAVLDAIAEAAALVFGGDAGFRILEGDELVRAGATPGAARVMAADRLRLGESISGRVAATGRAQIVTDIVASPDVIPAHKARVAPTTGSLACLPLRSGARVLGTLNVYRERGRAFDGEALELLETFANQAAIALDNARLHGAAVRRAEELGALLKATQAVRAAADLDSTLDAILEQASAMAGTEHVKIYLRDAAEGVLRVAAARGVPVPAGFSVPLGIGHTGIVAATGEPVFIADTPSHPDSLLPERDREHGIRTYLGLPVKHGAEVLGVLAFNTKAARVYSDSEVALLGSLADQAGIAIRSAGLYAALENRVGRLRTLARLNQLVSSALERDDVLREITKAAAELMQADLAVLWRFDARSGGFELALASDDGVAADFPVRRLSAESGFLGSIAAERRPLAIPDVLADPRVVAPDWWRGHGFRSFLGIPVIVDGELEAVLALVGRRGLVLGADDQQMLDTFVAQAAVAIRNARLFADSERRRNAAEALAEIGRALAQTRDPDAVGHRVVQAAMRLLGTVSSTLLRVEAATGDLVVVATDGVTREILAPGSVLPRGTWVAGRVALLGRPYLSADVGSDPNVVLNDEHRRFLAAQPPRSALGVPLLAQGEVVGVLSLAGDTGRRFTEDDLALASTLADQAALALETARLYRQTEQALADLKAAQDHLVRGETMRALGELASGAAHHLNNLLAIVIGRAQLMLAGVEPNGQRHGLEVIHRAARDGAEVVRRIQEFARREPTARAETVDLGALVRDVVEMTRARWHDAALAQGVAIDVRCELGPVPPISGHAAALREVVTNLILNAVDALPAGGHIVLATRTEGHTAVLTVSDDGVGMSEEVARRAHEPFFTTKGPKGTGLGLSVNYGVIRRHGGEQHIVSAPWAGTVVTVRLPAAAGAAPVPQAAPAPAAPGPVRVLVVDDEPEVLSLVAEMAKLLGYEAAAAAGSDDAVAALERGPLPDVVLTDHGMPGMTGRELAQVIRRRWPGVRVGLMTGWGDAVTSGPGVDFVLAKPLTLEDLGTRLQAAVAGEPAPTS